MDPPPPSFSIKRAPKQFARLEAPIGGPAAARGGRRGKVALAPEFSPLAWARFHNEATDLSGVSAQASVPSFTMDDVAKHNTRDDAWMVINGMIYNVTPYMKFHPGGVDELMRGVGKDGTAEFMEVHRWVTPMTMLQKCIVGPLAKPKTTLGAGGTARQQRPFLSGTVWKKAVVVVNAPAGGNSVLLRLALDHKDQQLGLPHAGSHVSARVCVGGSYYERSYTPVSKRTHTGTFDLVVKVYPTGRVSPVLGALAVGDSIMVKGPNTSINYSSGKVQIGRSVPQSVTSMVLLAGGSGITPMLQLMREVLHEKSGVKVHLVFANHSPADIMLRPVIEKAVAAAPNFTATFVVSHSEGKSTTVADNAREQGAGDSSSSGAGAGAGAGAGSSQPGDGGASGTGLVPVVTGRLGEELIQKVAPPATYDQLVAICGPPSFNTDVEAAMRALYYAAPMIFVY